MARSAQVDTLQCTGAGHLVSAQTSYHGLQTPGQIVYERSKHTMALGHPQWYPLDKVTSLPNRIPRVSLNVHGHGCVFSSGRWTEVALRHIHTTSL